MLHGQLTDLRVTGLPVYTSAFCLTDDKTAPVRKHSRRKGSLAYHRRVQKKWIKRFGFQQKTVMYWTPYGIFVHPSVLPTLRAALAEA